MKIDVLKSVTVSNPTANVTFHRADEKLIEEMSTALMLLPEDSLLAMRDGLAREIIYLVELGDWTSGEAEEVRHGRLEAAIRAHQATYLSHAYARITRKHSEK